ncbi:MAG: SusC/RagA family TonB-linked outer membrane protein [Gammaproteobacteria bacterium]|nr:SusC/RagA family TonB-linked outer membrane protein [Gammaproteobacteria bacterium]
MYNIYLNKRVPLPLSSRIRQLLLIMKLTTLILITVILHVSATSMAQKVTLNKKNAQLVDVFNDINAQTGYDFAFTTTTLKDAKPVTINVRNEELNDVLTQIFQGQNLEFTIENKSVVIKAKEETLIDKARAYFAQITISGKVFDETGQPLPGVTVKQKGTNNGVVTDAKGAYSLNVPDNNTVITFSYIGYETQEFTAKDIPNGSKITLKATATNLREVVVNKGYYTEKQELSTGNVSVVTAKEIQEQPVSDPILALEGRVPGLQISQTSGIPGSSSTIQLRGLNNIPNHSGPNGVTTVNDPLFIINGIPYGSASLTNTIFGGGAVGTPGGNQTGQGLSPFNSLNPSDIESIEILKDADATAIYGSRGANGVILITTRKGKSGDTKFDLNVAQGIGQVNHQISLLNTQQYLAMRHEAFRNDGATPGITDYDLNGAWDTTRNTNWQKLLIGNTAHYTDVQTSISGGNSNTQFLITGGYNRQTTVFPGEYSDRKTSLGFNLTHASNDQRFHAQLSANYVNDYSNLPDVDLTNKIYLAPDAPTPYDVNGNLNWQIVNGTPTWQNPLAYTVQNDKAITNNLISSLTLSYNIVPGLDLSSRFGYTHSQLNQTNLTPATLYAPPNDTSPSNRLNIFGTTDLQTWIIEPQISYKEKLGKGNLDILAGTTFEGDDSHEIVLGAAGFSSDALITNPAAASFTGVIDNQYTQYRYNALFGRMGYNYEEKYLLNITGRRDGSSRFGPGKQFGNFGAIGAGWIFTKEKLVSDNLPWLSFGKLRASYGVTGNDQIKDYQYLSTYTPLSTTYQGVTGLSPTQLTNPDYAWERVKKMEAGLDLGFLQNRINFTISYYRDRTTDQLIGYPLPVLTGFSSVQANLPAIIQNTGLELTANTFNVQTKDFTWSSSINLSVPRNKLVAYPNIIGSPYQYIYALGQSLYIQYLFQYEGVNSQSGIYKFRTDNSDGVPTYPKDLAVTKPISQQYYGGFQNSFKYKGLQLDFLIQFVKQTGVYKSTALPGNFNNGFSNQQISVLDHWQKNGDNSTNEQFSQGGTAALSAYYNLLNSDYIIVDASFIRLKNLAFSYDLPTTWQQKMHLQNTKIYLQCQNLFTITKYRGLDPETQGLGLPPLQMITLGLKTSL